MKVQLKEGIDMRLVDGNLYLGSYYLCNLSDYNRKFFEPLPLTLDDIKAGQKFTWGTGTNVYTKLHKGYFDQYFNYHDSIIVCFLDDVGTLKIVE